MSDAMKKFWVNVPNWDKNIVTTALESSADAVVIPKGFNERVKELGLIKTVAEDGDLKLKKDVIEVEINSKEDEERAAKMAKSKIVIVKTRDWKVIPLENLIAQTENLIAEVKNSEEAKLVLEILEKGVDGILLTTNNLSEIKKAGEIVKQSGEKIKLVEAEITRIENLGSGDRVCIDTCTNMKEGQGMLIGNSSGAMFLVHSESVENPYVASRPFRVNAGGVHAYVRTSEGKTAYLSDLKSGSSVLVVDWKGNTEISIVGRIKIEKRPLMIVEATAEGKDCSLILQNAETIRLTKSDGKPSSVVKLKIGDKVLAYVEDAGRHFGMKIKEKIVEK